MSLATLEPPVLEHAAALEVSRPVSLLDKLFSTTALYCALLAAVVYFSVPSTFADPDIWWHLRDAEILVHTHHFITHDTFSFTAAGAAWMNHEWLGELPFYAAWRLGGDTAVHALTLLLVQIIMFGIFGLAYARSRQLTLSVFLSVAGTLLATVSFGPRTLLFGWLLLLVELALLQLSAPRPRALWLLPPLFALWVNTHGSWSIGLVVYAVFVLGSALPVETTFLTSDALGFRDLRRRVTIAALSVAALFCNPYGWRLVAYPFNLAFHQKLNIGTIEEWRSVDFHTPRGKMVFTFLLALAIGQLVWPKRWKLVDLLIVLVGLYSGLTYARFLFLFAILAVPVLAETLGRNYQPKVRSNRGLLNAVCIVLLVWLCLQHTRQVKGHDLRAGTPLPDHFPAALNSLPPGARVFNEYGWGGRLIWLNHLPVFVDSRVDIFEYNGTFKDYIDITSLHDTLALLDHHHITHVLFEANTPFVYFLEHTGGWDTLEQDGKVVLLQRHTQVQATAPTPATGKPVL